MTSTADDNFYYTLSQGKENVATLERSDKRTKCDEQLPIDCDTPITKLSKLYGKKYKVPHKEPALKHLIYKLFLRRTARNFLG